MNHQRLNSAQAGGHRDDSQTRSHLCGTCGPAITHWMSHSGLGGGEGEGGGQARPPRETTGTVMESPSGEAT